MPGDGGYLGLGFFPQLVFWVGYTITIGIPRRALSSSMRAVVQRVSRAEVRVAGELVGRIGAGLLVLLGIAKEDTPEAGRYLAEKIVNLRVFDDAEGRMNRALVDVGPSASVLCVSQFTLYGDCRKGRRPSYDRAAEAGAARPLYEAFLDQLRGLGVRVEAGQFQAMMYVELVNDGPVTLLLDSDKAFF
jgi:D-tyrosyl-tRNA(Tyr) deacylase